MLIQLNPPIRLYTPLGPGVAHLFQQAGPESDQVWTVFLDNGQIWDFPNYMVRAQNNFTLGRWNPGLKERTHATAKQFFGGSGRDAEPTQRAQPRPAEPAREGGRAGVQDEAGEQRRRDEQQWDEQKSQRGLEPAWITPIL